MDSCFNPNQKNILSKELIDLMLNNLLKEVKCTLNKSAENISGLSASEEGTEQSCSDVVENGEYKESSVATPDIEYTFNSLIKDEPEMGDYEIENLPLEGPKNLYTNEFIHQERKFTVGLEKPKIIRQNNIIMQNLGSRIQRNSKLFLCLENLKVIDKDGNLIVDNINRLSDSALKEFNEYTIQKEPLVKIETNETIHEFEQMHEFDFKEWKIKNEELDIKEDLEDGEVSISPNFAARYAPEKIQEFYTETSVENQCNPQTEHTNYLKTQLLRHNPKEVQQSTGGQPSFKIIFRGSSKTHLEIQMFKCDQCDFQTQFKVHLEIHQLSHSWYKCDQCSYRTIRKRSLNKHLISHRNPEEVEMFRCNKCDFQTRFKNYLKIHQLLHSNSKFKCDHCSYKTVYKSCLKSHLISHRNPEEVEMFKCFKCDYQTKFKNHLKRHQLVHSNSEFKCDQCSYKTIRKGSLRKHLILHRNREEVEMFRCNKCDLQTRFKHCLKRHQLVHGNSKFKCDQCSYKTVHKGSLKIHLIVHQNPEEIEMFKCNNCSFQTKRKYSLKIHQLTHKNELLII